MFNATPQVSDYCNLSHLFKHILDVDHIRSDFYTDGLSVQLNPIAGL